MLNPYHVLDVAENSGDEIIRSAYLKMLRKHPLDRNQQAFQQIQQAYGLIKDSEARIQYRLFHVVTVTPQLVSRFIRSDQQESHIELRTFKAVLKSAIDKVSPP